MPVVCDFVKIIGDQAINIGDHSTPHGHFGGSQGRWNANFSTRGRQKDGSAFLIFNVSGLTRTKLECDVELNGKVIGHISPLLSEPALQSLHSGLTKYWFTQMIALEGSQLNDKEENTIQIYAAHYEGGPEQDISEWFDDFQLKDMFCFFKQSI